MATPAPARTYLVLTHRLGIRIALLLDVLSARHKEAPMVNSREDAARSAETSKTNVPGTCQLWTRNRYLALSAGDVDHDGDNDAVDGWKSEPISARHAGDRNPPRGVPVAFSGGSKGYGHRAVSLGGGKIRSTDMTATGYEAGVVGTTTITQIERSMGVTYTGWSETISGVLIPNPPPPAPPRKPWVSATIKRLRARRARINERLKQLRARPR